MVLLARIVDFPVEAVSFASQLASNRSLPCCLQRYQNNSESKLKGNGISKKDPSRFSDDGEVVDASCVAVGNGQLPDAR